MAYHINQNKVIGVVVEANQALNGKGFNHGEAILGLSELIGRIIVEAVENGIQSQEMIEIAASHMKKTVRIGAEAKGKRIIIGG